MTAGNTNVNRGMEIYENPGGRPSEGMCQVGGLTVLERDSSPVDPEDQRLAKKGRNKDGSKETFGDSGDLKDMDVIYEKDAGVSRGESEGVPNATKNPDLNDTSRVQPAVSYAAVTAKKGSVNNERGEDARLEPDEVVVNDEDCIIVNSGAFPTISRRRRNVAQVSKTRAGFNGSESGSRFEVLQDDTLADQNEVVVEEGSGRGLDLGDRNEGSSLRAVEQQPWITKNAAYLESNPTRQQKKDMDGKSGPGNHYAVSIAEPGISSRNGSRVRGGFGGGSGSRVGKENVFKGLRFRKNVESKDHGTTVLSNWVHQGAAHGVVDMVEDEPGDVLMHEQTNDLVVLGSTVDAVLSQGGGVNVPQ
ncbi:hypothetical protein V6N12_066199 [Hibiscus sabdariffa]|uniref:Uncharacterized protein n=1 Tax=Hibiscus sabdariffa TaxID=183260 RepID=A0ABR2B929_9ROSI